MSRPSIIDTPEIGARAKEIRDAEMRVLAGCNCLPDPATGDINHGEVCPLWPGLPPATPPAAIEVAWCDGDWIVAPWAACLAAHRRAVADAIDAWKARDPNKCWSCGTLLHPGHCCR